MGWCRNYWVYGASSVAIDPSGWRVLLVSHICRRESRKIQHHLSYCFFSLTSDMNYHVSQNPPVLQLELRSGIGNSMPGVRVHYFSVSWLSVNSLSSPVNDYSEQRWPTANVGVHSCINTNLLGLLRMVVIFYHKLSDCDEKLMYYYKSNANAAKKKK